MKSYRIGVDRLIAWHIVSDGVPYNLAGKNLTFKVSHPRGGFTVPSDGFTISGNVILWTFYGKDQKLLGPYSLTLIENEGQENMLTFDACNAFAFVSCTCQEGGIENPDLQLSSIDVETDLATIGIKLVVPVIGDNGNWFIGGVDTGHPVGGGSDCDCEQPDMFASSGEPGHIKNNIIRFHPSSSVTTVDVGALDEGDVIVAGVPYALWVRLGGNLMSPSRLGTSPVALKGINGPGIMVQFIGDGSGTCSLLKASPNYGVENYMTVTIGQVDTIPTTLLDGSVILRPELTEALSDKQDQIDDLEIIRSNAASAITQLQTILGPDATPAIDRFNEIISFLEGIEEGDEGKLAAIIASIEQQIGGKQEAIVGLDQRNWDDTTSKAATALQSETYRGTVTGVKMNGAIKNLSNGVVDLGTVITAHQDISGKQDQIDDLEIIRSNAASAITQLQTILGPDATPAIDRFNEIISFLEGIEEGDEGKLAAIIASIEQQIGGKQEAIVGLDQRNWDDTTSKAATALQSETYRGTVTGVKMNGAIKNLSNGVVDLGTVITAHQDISGKQDKISNLTQTSWDAVLTEAGKVSGKQEAIVGLNQRNWDDTASKAASALQSETYKGTVTGVKMNGATKNPSGGVVDLGTVITELPNMAINYGPSMSEWEPVPFTGDVAIRPYEFLIYDSAPSNYMTWSSQKIKSELDKKAALDSAPTFTGKVTAPAFYESSDETLKDFGEDIKIDFDKLKALPKKYFTWKSGGKKQIGTSAQEVQKLFPEIVGKSKDGTLTVDYSRLTMPALAAIDELYSENQELKRRGIELDKKTKALEERISMLEALMLN